MFQPLHSAVSKGVMLDSTCSYLLKALVLLFGILCIGVAYLTQFFGSILQMSLTLFGVIGGPVLAVFTMGVLNPYCNQKVSPFPYLSNQNMIQNKCKRINKKIYEKVGICIPLNRSWFSCKQIQAYFVGTCPKLEFKFSSTARATKVHTSE